MKKKPLVSIIIPVWNGEQFIADSINSVINQSYKDWELIIIDDGSKDNTLSLIKQYKSDHILIHHQENSGASTARNAGLRIAKGDYIQFLDADDLLSSNKIELQVEALEQNPNYIAVCSTVHFSDKEFPFNSVPSSYEESFIRTNHNPIDFLIKLWGGYDDQGSMVQPNAWLIPKHIIERAGWWDERLSLDDDGEFFARVVLNSKGIIKTEGAYNYYRKFRNSRGNLSSIDSKKAIESLLLSALSKKKLLLSYSNTNSAKQAIQRILFGVALASYPKYPDLTKQAESQFTARNYGRIQIGGNLINFIASNISWKLVRYLQYYKQKFLS